MNWFCHLALALVFLASSIGRGAEPAGPMPVLRSRTAQSGPAFWSHSLASRAALSGATAEGGRKPNIVFILADDLGYGGIQGVSHPRA